MPARSLNSSVLKWPDLSEVDQAVRVWVKKVAQSHPEISRIGYIGSYARGDWGVGSDLDLIVILEKSDLPFWRRSLELDYPEAPVPVDVMVYTQEEWRALAAQAGLFYRTVEIEAKWIFTRTGR